jgi:hypothetical protein
MIQPHQHHLRKCKLRKPLHTNWHINGEIVDNYDFNSIFSYCRFGNLVTMEWWDDLWLNEGFATYMQYISLNELEPQWQVRLLIFKN